MWCVGTMSVGSSLDYHKIILSLSEERLHNERNKAAAGLPPGDAPPPGDIALAIEEQSLAKR